MNYIKPTQGLSEVNPYMTGPASGKKKIYSELPETPKAADNDSPASVCDVFSSSQRDGRTGWTAGSVQEVLEELARRYPDIEISISQETDNRSPAQMAADAGSGLHIIISQKFMDRMGSSEEEFNNCMKILQQAFTHLTSASDPLKGAGAYLDENKVSFWQITAGSQTDPSAAVQAAGQYQDLLGVMQSLSGNQNTSALRMKTGSSRSSNVAAIYAKVARADSQFAVRDALSKARREILSLQMIACLTDDQESVKARAAIRSLNKLMVRGNRKIKTLDKEQVLSIRKRQAQKREELEQAREMDQERRKMRRRRMNEDTNLAQDGRREKHRIDRSGSSSGYMPPISAALPSVSVQGMGGGSMPGGELGASGVVVSAVIEF